MSDIFLIKNSGLNVFKIKREYGLAARVASSLSDPCLLLFRRLPTKCFS